MADNTRRIILPDLVFGSLLTVVTTLKAATGPMRSLTIWMTSQAPHAHRTVFALVAGLLWWIDLASRDAFNILEAFAISASAIGLPVFGAFVLAGLGYALRLFALYVASKAG